MEKEKEEKKRTERLGTCRFCQQQRWVEHIEEDALKACLEPIAAGEMVKASFRIDDLTTATVCIRQGRLTCTQTKKEDIIVDEAGGR